MNDYMQYSGASLYGNYRQRTFSEIFYNMDIGLPTVENFKTAWEESPFSSAVNEGELNLDLIFYLLYARYANSVIASSDEDRFIYQLHSIIFQYGPTWAKELSTQKDLRKLTIEDFQKGSENIINQAANPSGTPATDTDQILAYINSQNVSKTKRSLADGYALMLSLLKEDVTEKFLNRFQKLFLVIVEPERPLWYVDSEED